MTQDIEKYVDEYGSKFYPTVGYNRYQEESDWLRTTLTKIAEEAVQAERDRIVKWAKDRIDPMEPKYNEAMYDLIAYLSDK